MSTDTTAQSAPMARVDRVHGSTEFRLTWLSEPVEGLLYDRAALDAAVAAERERLRVLVQAVRDANHGAQGEYPFRLLTAQQDAAWRELLAALDGPLGVGLVRGVGRLVNEATKGGE